MKIITSFLFILLVWGSSAMADNTVSSTVITSGAPVPTASGPPLSVQNGNDLCIVGSSGAVQTQYLGIAFGGASKESENCLLLKKSRALHQYQLKIASVTLLCMNDPSIFDALWYANTPCPYSNLKVSGLIGDESKAAWLKDPKAIPEGSYFRRLIEEQITIAELEAKKKRKLEDDKTQEAKKPSKFAPLIGLLLLL